MIPFAFNGGGFLDPNEHFPGSHMAYNLNLIAPQDTNYREKREKNQFLQL